MSIYICIYICICICISICIDLWLPLALSRQTYLAWPNQFTKLTLAISFLIWTSKGSVVVGIREQLQQQLYSGSLCINRSSWIRWQPDLPSPCISFNLHYWGLLACRHNSSWRLNLQRRGRRHSMPTFNWVAAIQPSITIQLYNLDVSRLQAGQR